MKRTLIITAGLCMCWLSAPSYAQSSTYETALLGHSTDLRVGLLQNEYVEPRLAVTFSAEPELRLNSHEIYAFGGEQVGVSQGIKTAGKVALGVGLIALAAGVLFFGAFYITYEPEE